MQKINFQDTEVVKAPYVEINGVEYEVESEYEGGTDLNASTFNTMQDNIDNGKQDTLVGSGTGQNIKTINGNSILGSGNINVNTIIGNALSIQTEQINLSAFAAGEARWNQTKAVTIATGYSCIGIVGYEFSGGGFTNLTTPELYYNNGNIHYSVCDNTSNITGDIVFKVKLLLVKNQ